MNISLSIYAIFEFNENQSSEQTLNNAVISVEYVFDAQYFYIVCVL